MTQVDSQAHAEHILEMCDLIEGFLERSVLGRGFGLTPSSITDGVFALEVQICTLTTSVIIAMAMRGYRFVMEPHELGFWAEFMQIPERSSGGQAIHRRAEGAIAAAARAALKDWRDNG